MEILFLLFGFLAFNVLLHVKAESGFISIDCGVDEDYKDKTTNIFYNSDAKFIDSGENTKLSFTATYKIFDRQRRSVRSFPQGDRNCYTLSPEQGRDNKYLIRALFMYGNYDSKNQLPVFKLYLGVEEWDTIRINDAYSSVLREIIHVPKTDDIYVCLVNTGSGTPFISALELRHLDNSMYDKAQSGSLVLSRRLNFGSTTNETIRFQDDQFDRIWSPFSWSTWTPIAAPFGSSSLSESSYKVPSKVMETAAKPTSGTTLDFTLGDVDPSQEFYLYFHFAELQEVGNQIRQFTISLNEKIISSPVQPKYLDTATYFTQSSISGSQLVFSLAATSQSALPPIMNALEIYRIKKFSQSPTEQSDVDAMKKIKSVYKVVKISWQGDPCLPRDYSWDGLICSYNGYDASSITSLNLSSSDLTGKIDSSFSNLVSLQSLDLSYNSLGGEVPEFLSEMASLKTLNLSGNKLTGSVPSGLLAKSNNGTLSLSLDGNPHLCKTNSCNKEVGEKGNKEKNIVIPVVVSISVVLVLTGTITILWPRFKMGRQKATDAVKPNGIKKAFGSKNQHFSYSEVVNITNDFQKVIGKGGFGSVYSGQLKDGTQVAVKMLSPSSTQGSKQFRAEAQLLTRVHHRNLASLIGYCDEGSSMGLIYEYMANGNLEEYLSGKNAAVLSWEQRLRIALDAAQALEYLHNDCEPPIVHRDVKSANILLNEKMQAKVSDFGLSRIIPLESGTHVSTSVVGTPGYVDPEYYITTRLNEKSDVYSFGIVLLELITGQPAIIKSHDDAIPIAQWVSSIVTRGEIRGVVDPRLERDFDTNSAWKAVEIAMACVPSSSIKRPTMSDVVGELKECLNIEIAQKRSDSRKEDYDITSSTSLEMVVFGFEDAVGPQAR